MVERWVQHLDDLWDHHSARLTEHQKALRWGSQLDHSSVHRSALQKAAHSARLTDWHSAHRSDDHSVDSSADHSGRSTAE